MHFSTLTAQLCDFAPTLAPYSPAKFADLRDADRVLCLVIISSKDKRV